MKRLLSRSWNTKSRIYSVQAQRHLHSLNRLVALLDNKSYKWTMGKATVERMILQFTAVTLTNDTSTSLHKNSESGQNLNKSYSKKIMKRNLQWEKKVIGNECRKWQEKSAGMINLRWSSTSDNAVFNNSNNVKQHKRVWKFKFNYAKPVTKGLKWRLYIWRNQRSQFIQQHVLLNIASIQLWTSDQLSEP